MLHGTPHVLSSFVILVGLCANVGGVFVIPARAKSKREEAARETSCQKVCLAGYVVLRVWYFGPGTEATRLSTRSTIRVT